MSGMSANLSPFKEFLFLFWKEPKLVGAKTGDESGGESTCQSTIRGFSSKLIPVTLSALPNNTVDSPFILVQ
jgi:hypothetical protein